MKHFRRITALALAAMMVFGCAITAQAGDEVYSKHKKGEDYSLVGKGVEDDTIAINLKGRDKVTSVYYITNPDVDPSQYVVKIEDIPDDDEAEIDLIYNETLKMYSIKIVAKDLLDTTFTLRFVAKINGVNQAYAYKSVPLTVFDDDRFITSIDRDDDEYDTALDELKDQAATVNVVEGLKSCSEGQSLIVDISSDRKIAHNWLKTLKKTPAKTMIFTDDNYALTVKETTASDKSMKVSYKVGVEVVRSKLGEWAKTTGVKDARPVVVTGVNQLPAKMELTVRISGVPYKNASVNIYKYENGKATKIASGVKTDGFGVLDFPGYIADGTYVVSRY